MALNWAMISEDGSRPVPLPGEKIFFSVEKCSISLNFSNQGVKWTATGNAFVTSKRILFLRQPPLPAPADPSVSSMHLRSLSVPLSQFIDTRYLIPVFTAPYFEASIVPSPDGGLPQPAPTGNGQRLAANNVGLMKLWFNEGGGMAFRDAVEEVKSRLDEGSTHIEALPLYEPPSENSSSTLPNVGEMQITDAEPTRQHLAPPRQPTRADSLPDPEDLEAAQVAHEAEERERDIERQNARQMQQTLATSTTAPPQNALQQQQHHDQTQQQSNVGDTEVRELDEHPPPYPA